MCYNRVGAFNGRFRDGVFSLPLVRSWARALIVRAVFYVKAGERRPKDRRPGFRRLLRLFKRVRDTKTLILFGALAKDSILLYLGGTVAGSAEKGTEALQSQQGKNRALGADLCL